MEWFLLGELEKVLRKSKNSQFKNCSFALNRKGARIIPQSENSESDVLKNGLYQRKDVMIPKISSENWNSTPEEIANELHSFIAEFGSFTPEWFAEVKFHLIRYSGLTQKTRDELCEVAIYSSACTNCDHRYVAKRCLLWYRLWKIINWNLVKRAPPCIRLAFAKKSIKTVANYLTKTHLIDPPFYKARGAPTCKLLKRWGYCNPDEYCHVMTTGSTLEYSPSRERVKLSKSQL
ncbi:MAG: hypothetical protein ACW968_10940 [Candidatus Thorarchaeota archaeon]